MFSRKVNSGSVQSLTGHRRFLWVWYTGPSVLGIVATWINFRSLNNYAVSLLFFALTIFITWLMRHSYKKVASGLSKAIEGENVLGQVATMDGMTAKDMKDTK